MDQVWPAWWSQWSAVWLGGPESWCVREFQSRGFREHAYAGTNYFHIAHLRMAVFVFCAHKAAVDPWMHSSHIPERARILFGDILTQ